MKDFDRFELLLEKFEVKAHTKIIENIEDANLRRFKDKWLFITTIILILFSFICWILFVVLRPDSPHINIVLNSGFGLVMALCGYYVKGKI